MFMETNPIPVKTALHMMGIFDNLEFRLPMVPLEPENEPKLRDILKEAKLV